jgi:hypothetical protein
MHLQNTKNTSIGNTVKGWSQGQANQSAGQDEVSETSSCTFTRNLVFGALYKEDMHSRENVLRSIETLVLEWTDRFIALTKNVTNQNQSEEETAVRPKLQYYGSSNSSNGSVFQPDRRLKREASSRLGLDFNDIFDDLDIEQYDQSGSYKLAKTPVSSNDDGQRNRDESIESQQPLPPVFEINYKSSISPIFREATKSDERLRQLEDLKDEVLTIDEMQDNLRKYHLTILRLSLECPYTDVRTKCQHMLDRIQVSLSQRKHRCGSYN